MPETSLNKPAIPIEQLESFAKNAAVMFSCHKISDDLKAFLDEIPWVKEEMREKVSEAICTANTLAEKASSRNERIAFTYCSDYNGEYYRPPDEDGGI